MEWMILPLKRYVDFGGRSRRKEFWMFVVLTIVVSLVASLLDSMLGLRSTNTIVTGNGIVTTSGTGLIGKITSLALLIPSLAVSIRRLHDTDRSAWWILLSFVPILGWIALLVFYCLEGTPGTNRFGPDPKGADLGQVFS